MASFALSDVSLADLDDPALARDALTQRSAPRGVTTPLAARSFASRVASERSRRFTHELQQRGFALNGRIARAGLPPIDHLVVAPSGVWIVASERVTCARVSVRRRHLAGDHRLRIGSRDRTGLLDTLDHQVAAVRAELFDALDAPVRAALVLPGAEFPLLRTLIARDHLILRPGQLLGQLEARGPLRRSRARVVAGLLDARLA